MGFIETQIYPTGGKDMLTLFFMLQGTTCVKIVAKRHTTQIVININNKIKYYWKAVHIKQYIYILLNFATMK